MPLGGFHLQASCIYAEASSCRPGMGSCWGPSKGSCNQSNHGLVDWPHAQPQPGGHWLLSGFSSLTNQFPTSTALRIIIENQALQPRRGGMPRVVPERSNVTELGITRECGVFV